MKKRVIIIGGGVAGMQTALRLAEQGVSPVIIEKEAELGGKLRGWHVLFPSFTPAQEVLTELRRRVNESGIEVMTSTEVAGFTKESVTLADGRTLPCDSVVVASGFTLFDASIKEEYGYGIYDNVFTTADIERMLNEGRVAKADGSRPRRIAFLHCVGSRDEKVCQQHCSKVCCITGVKQAMEMKQLFPEADVFNFYMDIRMFGPGYEEMYREAQQRYNIHFLRGRISEASPTIDGRVQIKAEDTLTGRPLRMSVDMLGRIGGPRANDDNEAFAAGAGLNRAPSGFLAPRDMFLGNVKSNVAGRLDEVKDLIEEIEKRAEAMCIQERLYRVGKLKKRTNHCDTKVNNMMFDAETDKVLCVIDLDTVMPGFVLSDIGDFIRTGANTGAEDDENLDNVNVNMDIFKAYTRGYMEKAKSFLTPTEIKLLPYGGRLLTYMQTVRFLTDYINGDTYYKIHSPKHNLIRTKAQFKLLQSLEAHADEMDAFMSEWL